MSDRAFERPMANGVTLLGHTHPSIRKFSGFNLLLTVELRDANDQFAGSTSVKGCDTEAEAERLFQAVRIIPCLRCGAPSFDPETVTASKDLCCRACFDRDIEAFAAAEREKLRASDQQQKQQGKTVRVSVWIHPVYGGDDYQEDWYLAKMPTDEHVQGMIRRSGSAIVDDYRIAIL